MSCTLTCITGELQALGDKFGYSINDVLTGWRFESNGTHASVMRSTLTRSVLTARYDVSLMSLMTVRVHLCTCIVCVRTHRPYFSPTGDTIVLSARHMHTKVGRINLHAFVVFVVIDHVPDRSVKRNAIFSSNTLRRCTLSTKPLTLLSSFHIASRTA
jgi:hypothetical protein